jgi:hypothetical protein
MANNWCGEDWHQNKACKLAQDRDSHRTTFPLTPAGGPVALPGDSQSLQPLLAIAITEAIDFTNLPAKAIKSQQEIQQLVDSAYGDKTLSIILIHWIIKAIKNKQLH